MTSVHLDKRNQRCQGDNTHKQSHGLGWRRPVTVVATAFTYELFIPFPIGPKCLGAFSVVPGYGALSHYAILYVAAAVQIHCMKDDERRGT